MPGTETASGAICLCACYAKSGTDPANDATRLHWRPSYWDGGRVGFPIGLRACYAISGTLAWRVALSAYVLPMRYAVLTRRMALYRDQDTLVLCDARD
eukprot:3193234-Rhodomonas_salina.3